MVFQDHSENQTGDYWCFPQTQIQEILQDGTKPPYSSIYPGNHHGHGLGGTNREHKFSALVFYISGQTLLSGIV